MTDSLSVQASVLFCDDIRVESTGKLFCVGVYTARLGLFENAPVDRLGVLVSIRWPRDYRPDALAIKLLLPGMREGEWQPLDMPSSYPELPPGQLPSPFAGMVINAVINVRFPAARIGDVVDLWLRADGRELPVGRLDIVDGEVEARTQDSRLAG